MIAAAGGLSVTDLLSPLAVRMRPISLAEVAGQQHLLGPGSPLRRLVEPVAGGMPPAAVLMWGPPGVGKTSLAHLMASAPGRAFVEVSGVAAGVKELRAAVDQARRDRDRDGTATVLFVDEIHRFSKTQQDALLPAVENRWVLFVGATTENPSFSVVGPLLSRALLLTLHPLTTADVGELLDRAVTDPRGLGGRIRLGEQAREALLRLAGGDARAALTALETAAEITLAAEVRVDEAEPREVTVADIALAVDQAVVRYDRAGDQHYDVTSAFIKSLRGSDVDASLHYLARMLAAGEDPRFIARRLVILASEDIGMADPTALITAVAAMQAVQLVGLPEGRLSLAQAVIHLATAPKSNAVILAIDSAMNEVRGGATGAVPPHLRDAHYVGAAKLGHGISYKYPHNEVGGISRQQYPPDELVNRDYYEPSKHGAEARLAELVPRLRTAIRGKG